MSSEDEVTVNEKDNLGTAQDSELQLQIPREPSPFVPPNRPVSAANSITSSITGKVLDIDPEAMNQLDSPIVAGPATEEDNEDEEDDSAGYEESAERDEIIRERINRTQEQMR